MSGLTTRQTPAGSSALSSVLPHLVLHNFLDEDLAARLLDYAIGHEAEFRPSQVFRRQSGRVDPQARVSVATRRLRQFGPILTTKLLGRAPEFLAALQAAPVEAPQVELELVAHNDGAFYARHTDTVRASDEVRVLSGVYYFHAKPKAFTGGALRLLSIGDPTGTVHVDIEPADNTLVVFHAWAPHEVMPVACPSRRFGASRFAINCWIYRKRGQGVGASPAPSTKQP